MTFFVHEVFLKTTFKYKNGAITLKAASVQKAVRI